MKTKAKNFRKRPTPQSKKSAKTHPPTPRDSHLYPRCTRCGSRTVHLERMQQELLATISLHCLICGHYTFLGKPVIRLIRRPNIPNPIPLRKIRPSI